MLYRDVFRNLVANAQPCVEEPFGPGRSKRWLPPGNGIGLTPAADDPDSTHVPRQVQGPRILARARPPARVHRPGGEEAARPIGALPGRGDERREVHTRARAAAERGCDLVRCMGCGRLVEVPISRRGRRLRCTRCGAAGLNISVIEADPGQPERTRRKAAR